MALDSLYKRDIRPAVDGNIQILTGGDNVRSALENRLSTSFRSIPFRPNYGINLKEFLNIPLSSDNRSKLINEVQAQVIRDPRVKEVRNIELETRDNNLVAIKIQLDLVGTEDALNVEVKT